MANKIYIIGNKGFIGNKLASILRDSFEIYGSDKEKDASDFKTFYQTISRFNLDVIVNCVTYPAGLADSEQNPLLTRKANVEVVENIFKVAKRLESKVVQLSTDMVFDGRKGNYSEKDNTGPINIYGKTKLEAENLISQDKNNLILRTSTFYGHNCAENKRDFTSKILQNLSRNLEIKVQTDEVRTPTLVDDLANVIKIFIKENKTGIWNVTGSEAISQYDFAVKIARLFNLDENLLKATSSCEFELSNIRPKNCSLNISKLQKEGIKMKSINEGLKIMKEQMMLTC